MLSFRQYLIEQSKPGKRFTTHGGRFTNPTPEQIKMMDSDPDAWYNQIDLRTSAEKAAAETDPILKRMYELDAATQRFSEREKEMAKIGRRGDFSKDLSFDERLTQFPEGFGDSSLKPKSPINKAASGVFDPTDFVTRNLKLGPAMVAGVVGNLAGEHIVKPAAEKLGVFDAVGTASKAAFETMPPEAVDVADKTLGAAQYVLSGGPVSDTVSAVADAISASNKKEAQKEVDRAKSGNLGPRPGPKF
jgi:hypothetical protein